MFVYALFKQLDEVEELEDLSLLHYEMVFASFFLILLLARFVYMQRTRPTVLPTDAPQTTRLSARAVHLAMYCSLALVAITGLGIGGLYWNGTKAGTAMETLLLVHEICVISSYWLIAGHVAAALYHRSKKDGIWDAMVPVWKESRD